MVCDIVLKETLQSVVNCPLVSSWYHFIQWNRTYALRQCKGMFGYIRNQRSRERWYTKMILLPLLHLDSIPTQAEKILAEGQIQLKNKKVGQFCTNFKKTWLQNASLGTICMYDNSNLMESSASLEHYSTTHNIEKKNKNIGVHPFFYFVAFLQNHEGDQTPEMSRLIRSSDVASVNNVYMVRVTVQLFSLKI